MKLTRAATLAALLIAAAPAAGQNTAAPAPAPPPKTEPASPPSTTAPTGNVIAPAPEPAQPVPVTQQPQLQTLPIQPDAQYPNGFQDPANPFANEYQAYRDEQQGFPWGLLGLLGLLGLIPLIRGNGTVRTLYVERDEPRRVIREEDRP